MSSSRSALHNDIRGEGGRRSAHRSRVETNSCRCGEGCVCAAVHTYCITDLGCGDVPSFLEVADDGAKTVDRLQGARPHTRHGAGPPVLGPSFKLQVPRTLKTESSHTSASFPLGGRSGPPSEKDPSHACLRTPSPDGCGANPIHSQVVRGTHVRRASTPPRAKVHSFRTVCPFVRSFASRFRVCGMCAPPEGPPCPEQTRTVTPSTLRHRGQSSVLSTQHSVLPSDMAAQQRITANTKANA
ncbi:hypothetical protein L226DRAFT_203980 [Lentinus tigrinus ALCF2SS1-7]|uniref:uncharacterized protein n=1 Tax=Lentinus tigrinus ALCF2SS1-7 TaxID=1328758 RepID=UPI001165CA70|nr:hypothetical protein L226DRAFT_203980 [Lentinus tigrinus ALCF2SS1-7]